MKHHVKIRMDLAPTVMFERNRAAPLSSYTPHTHYKNNGHCFIPSAVVVLRSTSFFVFVMRSFIFAALCAEAVQSATLALKRVHLQMTSGAVDRQHNPLLQCQIST